MSICNQFVYRLFPWCHKASSGECFPWQCSLIPPDRTWLRAILLKTTEIQACGLCGLSFLLFFLDCSSFAHVSKWFWFPHAWQVSPNAGHFSLIFACPLPQCTQFLPDSLWRNLGCIWDCFGFLSVFTALTFSDGGIATCLLITFSCSLMASDARQRSMHVFNKSFGSWSNFLRFGLSLAPQTIRSRIISHDR